MKKIHLLGTCLLLSLTLTACSETSNQNAGKILTMPQPLEGLNTTTVNQTTTPTTPQPETTDPKPTTDIPSQELPDLSTTEAFVDYMNTSLTNLESQHASINANVTLLSTTTDENMKSQFIIIKDNLFNQIKTEWNTLYNLTLPNQDVSKLKDYVCDAYFYTIEDGNLQYKLVLETDETSRKEVLAVSNDITYKRDEAIRLAKEEIGRLSNNSYYSK